MTSRFERASMCIAVGCAVVTTGIVARSQLFGPIRTEAAGGPPTAIADWSKLAAVGHRMGPKNAPVTIVEFADFQCPACRRFVDGALDTVQSAFPGRVAVVFHNWPLSYHPFAYRAARAAECAAQQGRFGRFYELVYREQDSLGMKPFVSFAIEAGVTDTAAFRVCNDRTDRVPAIEADIAAARSIGGTGTPTIIVNGLLLHAIPDADQLKALVRTAIARANKQTGGRGT